MTDTSLESFRKKYRAGISTWYRGPVHAGFIFVFGILSILFFLSLATEFKTLEVLTFVLTVVGHNLLEYFVHQKMGHRKTTFGALFFQRHNEEHHRFFLPDSMSYESMRDWRVLFFPAYLLVAVFLVLAVPGYFLFSFLINPSVGAVYAASILFCYVVYEFCHHAYHLPEGHWLQRLPGLKQMTRIHRLHHVRSKMVHQNLNIIFPLTDWLMGTLVWNDDLANKDRTLDKFLKLSTGDEVTAWVHQIESAKDKTVADYLVLQSILSTSADSDEALKLEAKALARVCRVQLTGVAPGKDDDLRPLPWKVLRRASRLERAFHAALFRKSAALDLKLDYIPELKDIVIILSLVLAAVLVPGVDIFLFSLIIGYLGTSFMEALAHKVYGHTRKSIRDICKNHLGFVGRYFLQGFHSHALIHHAQTFRQSHVTQFASEQEKQLFQDKLFATKFEHLPDNFAQKIVNLGFATRSTMRGNLIAQLPLIPLYVFLISYLQLGWIGMLAFLIPIVLQYSASSFLHAYLHQDQQQAYAAAGVLVRPLLKTRYVEMISRHHFIHHESPANYNLLFGADMLLGNCRFPNLEQFRRMHSQKILGAV